MRKRGWTLPVIGLLMVECFPACAIGAPLNQKTDSTVPIPANSPPEGNTTFVSGVTWCIALPGVLQSDLQKALDWACGPGMADCSEAQPGGLCFEPDTLLSHASYAFNSYYQQNGNSDIACNFGGTATITRKNPSYGSCNYLSSEQSSAYSINVGNFPALLLGSALITISTVYRILDHDFF